MSGPSQAAPPTTPTPQEVKTSTMTLKHSGPGVHPISIRAIQRRRTHQPHSRPVGQRQPVEPPLLPLRLTAITTLEANFLPPSTQMGIPPPGPRNGPVSNVRQQHHLTTQHGAVKDHEAMTNPSGISQIKDASTGISRLSKTDGPQDHLLFCSIREPQGTR